MGIKDLLITLLPIAVSIVGYLIKKGNEERQKTNAMLEEIKDCLHGFVKISECKELMKGHCVQLDELKKELHKTQTLVVELKAKQK